MQTHMPATSVPSGLNLLLLLLLLFVGTSEATTINITNRCSYTVWPAALPVGGGARELKSGQVWTLDMPAGISNGRIWARTGCSFSSNGKGSCQTGDCEGAFACNILGKPPYTFAELSTSSPQNYFDISVVDGFNVPMDFLSVPVQEGEKECSKGPRCAANITSQCPEEMKVPGGCNNKCTGTGSSNCTYSAFFKGI